MVKLVALYRTPADIENFEKLYFETHIPLVSKIPGLIKTEISRLHGMTGQESRYYMLAEMYFEDMEKLNEGMASPEGKSSARNLMGFAKDIVELLYGEERN